MARAAALGWVVLLTLTGVLLAPLRASAAILPACEVDPPVTIAVPAEPVCEVVTSVDDATGETTAAPICDPDGASAIAPPRVLPIADAWIDAAPCGDDGLAPLLGAARERLPGGGDPSSLDLTILSPMPAVGPAAPMQMLPRPKGRGFARSGFPPAVYHPPRAR